MLLLENTPGFTLWHDPTCAGLYATWQGRHPSSQTKAQYALIRRQLHLTRSTKLLHDSLLDEDGWASLTRWLAEDYFRVLAAEGLQALAWVLPRQLAALYDTAQVVKHLSRPLVDTFADAQAAYDWLHHWPITPPHLLPTEPPLTVAAFLLLPPARQVALATQHGRTMAPRWEADYYIKPYRLFDTLVVEVAYHLHSGVLHQVQVRFPG